MSAPLSGPLFHGTIETLPEGGEIKPRDKGDVAWATGRLDYAVKHAEERVRTGFGAKSGGEWPVHHGNIYEVEPIDPKSVHHNESHPDPDAYYSTTGFRVKRQVASAIGPQEDREVIKKRFKTFDPNKESYVERGRERFE
jgi:hypothetical protein